MARKGDGGGRIDKGPTVLKVQMVVTIDIPFGEGWPRQHNGLTIRQDHRTQWRTLCDINWLAISSLWSSVLFLKHILNSNQRKLTHLRLANLESFPSCSSPSNDSRQTLRNTQMLEVLESQ